MNIKADQVSVVVAVIKGKASVATFYMNRSFILKDEEFCKSICKALLKCGVWHDLMPGGGYIFGSKELTIHAEGDDIVIRREVETVVID